MQSSPVLSLASSSSPSFNSYSNSSLADIAARVVEEFRAENENASDFLHVGDLFCGLEDDIRGEDKAKGHLEQEDEEEQKDDGDEQDEDEEEEEFEFALVPRDAELSLISADQIFYNGQIRPVFPIFNRNLLLGDVESGNSVSNSLLTSSSGEKQQKASAAPQTIRLPLRKLLSEDRETPSSCSSSEADELEEIPEGTYCVWRPKAAAKEEEEASPGKCKKSNSTGTGSSKRWRLRDLVNRSNSDGKDTFVFLTPSLRKGEDKQKLAKPTSKAAGKSKPKPTAATHYTKNRGDKRRSYLPYRQDLVGFFANVNGHSRNLQPF